MCKVDDGDAEYACGYQNFLGSILNYPVYFPLVRAFQSTSGDIGSLANMINTVKSTCKDATVLGSFSENHDSA